MTDELPTQDEMNRVVQNAIAAQMQSDEMLIPNLLTMFKYRIVDAEAADTHEIAIDQASGAFLELANLIDTLKEIQTEAKILIAEAMAELNTEKLRTSAANIYYTSPGITTKYDTRGLDALCASLRTTQPDVVAMIEAHRSENPRAGTLNIKGLK